jgi:predicted SprT family Zn-dependent metalloprotease
MKPTHHRTCTCGAIYDRTEHMAKSREIASYECAVCNRTMETWNTAWVPIYRFVAGPVRLPAQE